MSRADCPPEWTIKSVEHNYNLSAVNKANAAWLAHKYDLRVKQAILFVNKARNNARLLVRLTEELIQPQPCPVCTHEVCWASPSQTLLFFTRWLYAVHNCPWTDASLLWLMQMLAEQDEQGRRGRPPRTSSKRTPRSPRRSRPSHKSTCEAPRAEAPYTVPRSPWMRSARTRTAKTARVTVNVQVD